MSLIVQKFGGSSVRDTERLLRMAHIAKERRGEGYDVVVVLSAQGDTTDTLLEKAHELASAPDGRELEKGRVAVVAGFQGIDGHGDITTLGRGGSDTSAVALAAALHADELTIYTDVAGIFSSDPRICPDAVRRARISYDDMLLLARKGAQVLHDRSVELARRSGVAITVRSCEPGSGESVVSRVGEAPRIVGVTQKKNEKSALAAITAVGGALPDIASERAAVTALEKGGVSVYAVASGERFLSLYVMKEDAERALRLAHSALIR